MNKHGIRPLEERFSKASLKKQIELAQLNVLKRVFRGERYKIGEPILARLETALRTNEQEYDLVMYAGPNALSYSTVSDAGFLEEIVILNNQS
ncbi:hypothetical protein [Pseudoalteromonas luteoviolacea]|nr:hypothetical protein [Pseudoalteromonas luteoviolacea]